MRRKAFTLVELLVVIAIITILAAMLLPTLERSIGQARLINCASRQHGLYLAYASYADDFGDHMPAPTCSHRPHLMNGLYDENTGLPQIGNLGAFFKHKYLDVPEEAYCTDVKYRPAGYAAALSYLRQNGSLPASATSALWATYIVRGGYPTGAAACGQAFNNCFRWKWEDEVDYGSSYMGMCSEKFSHNLAGARFSGTSLDRRMRSPRALLFCALPAQYFFTEEQSSVHGFMGFNILFADGVSHPGDLSRNPRFLSTSIPWREKFCGADTQHPSYSPPWNGYAAGYAH